MFFVVLPFALNITFLPMYALNRGIRDIGLFFTITAAASLFAALSMAGLPLTFGFVAKDAITFAKNQADVLHLVSYATVFVNAVSVAVAAIAAVRVFWGRDVIERRIVPHEANLSMLLPPLLLVALGLLFGFKPALVDPVLGASAHAMAPGFDAATLETSYDFLPVLEAILGSVGFGVRVDGSNRSF